MLRHIVLARFPADLPDPEIEGLFADLRAVKDKIPGLLAVHGGQNVSTEGFNRGYTHLFTMDFADAAAFAAYLPHPAHKPVSDRLQAAAGGQDADSDEAGRAFQSEAGHLFRDEAGRRSASKPATRTAAAGSW